VNKKPKVNNNNNASFIIHQQNLPVVFSVKRKTFAYIYA